MENEIQPINKHLAVYRTYNGLKSGKLYAGQYPMSKDENMYKIKIRELMDLKITSIICLLEKEKLQSFIPYESITKQLNYDVKIYNFPITDFSIPEINQMISILDKIDELLSNNENVYVHCWGGNGRTGTVIGCWLRRHNISGEDALDKIMEWRSKTLFGSDFYSESPETEEQKEFVRNWENGK